MGLFSTVPVWNFGLDPDSDQQVPKWYGIGPELGTLVGYFVGMSLSRLIACDMTTELNVILYNSAISMMICGSCKDYLEGSKIQPRTFRCAL